MKTFVTLLLLMSSFMGLMAQAADESKVDVKFQRSSCVDSFENQNTRLAGENNTCSSFAIQNNLNQQIVFPENWEDILHVITTAFGKIDLPEIESTSQNLLRRDFVRLILT